MVAHPLDDEAVFNIARKIESAALRAEYVQQVCGNDPQLLARVERLLRIHEQERDFLQAPAAGVAATVDVPDVHERPGMVIGHYKLLQRIGEGGFGVVFMAEQETPVRRTVAFKIIKPGMDSREVVARFEAERQALAMMNHPNIAHVFDGGVTESGRPVLRHGAGQRRSDHGVLRQERLANRGTFAALCRRLPRGAARPSEGCHSSGPQTVEHHGHSARWPARREGH